MQDWDDSIRTNEGEACHHGAVVLAGQDLIAGHHRHIPLILPLARLLRLPLLWRPALLLNPSEVPLYQSPELNLTGELQKNVTASDKGCFREHAFAHHGSLSNKYAQTLPCMLFIIAGRYITHSSVAGRLMQQFRGLHELAPVAYKKVHKRIRMCTSALQGVPQLQ